MNHDETNDWRIIAHDEYENRKNMELQVLRTNSAVGTLKQTLKTSNNYNNILEKKVTELENKCNTQEERLTKCIELLKNAKILIAQRKKAIEELTAENSILKDNLNKKTAMLEAEMLQHDKTNHKLAQTLNKLVTAAALTPHSALPPPARMVTSPDVIYAEAAPTDPEMIITKKESVMARLFSAFTPDESNEVLEKPESTFIEKQYNK